MSKQVVYLIVELVRDPYIPDRWINNGVLEVLSDETTARNRLAGPTAMDFDRRLRLEAWEVDSARAVAQPGIGVAKA